MVARAQEQVGAVGAVEGQAEVLHPGASTWTPLAVGAPILQGDQLRTQRDAKLRVALREGSVLTLAANSRLTVTEQAVAPAPVSRFELLLGVVRAVVPDAYAQPEARFEVETPTAVAGVRGTSFLAAYDVEQEETLVVGLEDVTNVRALVDVDGAAEVDVGPGIATRVRRGSRPLAPARLPEDRLRSLQRATELGELAKSGSTNKLDARRPQRPGERARSTEEQAVDQPLFKAATPKPPPPPPPVPRSGR